MEEIKPKKEKRFLKAVGKVTGILIQEFVLGLGRKFISKKIDKIGNKRQALLIFLALFCNIAFASVDSIPYPITGNKQRLGWQTTGNGLVYRGRASDTITKPSNYANKDIKAYLLVDTVNNVMYSYIASKGGWKFNNSDTVIIQGATMPFDSITFNTAKDGTVGVGEVEYNDTQGSLIQGLKGGNVTNVIGQQLHQRVNNRTGATLNKGDVVYLSGSQGNRITVAKAIATSDPTSANTFGIVAESIADNASGYVITEGLITGLNTSALTQDSAVYLSGTTAGALTSTKPQAPIHGVYIGVCVKSNAGSGELFCKIRNGLELDELHDVQITSPVNNSSLYYKSSDGLWRDTTAALLVSDTASMLTNYFRDADTTSLNLTSRFAAKLNLSDTASMLTNYLRSGVAASTYLTQSNAASTYLPLTGGTLSGSILNSWTFAYSSAPRNDGAVRRTYTQNLYSANGGNTDRVIHYYTYSQDECCAVSIMYYGRFNGYYNQANIIYDASIYYHNNNQFYYRAFSESENKVTFSIKPSNTVNSISGTKADLYLSGDAQIDRSLNIGTTLGVTGQTTLSNLAGTGTRMVVASSAGLLSTQTIPTGTVTSVSGSGAISVANGTTTPVISVADAAFGTAGIVSATGTQQFSGDKVFEGITQFNGRAVFKDYTYTATRLAGLSSTDRFATVTIGTGLSLSSGTLSSTNTGTVTNVTGTLPISVANGTTTPSITIANASTTASGVVTTGTQSFAGNKTFTGTLDVSSTGTFGGRVNTPWLERTYVNSTSSSFTVGVNTTWLDINTNVLTTLTLPNAANYPGKELHIRQTGSGSLQSASSNIIPFSSPPTGSPVTAILLASTHRAVTLVSDGTNWIIMQRSDI